jgi:hypothetical protein
LRYLFCTNVVEFEVHISKEREIKLDDDEKNKSLLLLNIGYVPSKFIYTEFTLKHFLP